MRAAELAGSYPTVAVDSDALLAARLIADVRLPGLIVLDRGRPHSVLPASQVLRFVLPGYVQEDPALGRVLGEQQPDLLAGRLAGRTVRELLPPAPPELPVVDAGASLLEVAAVMTRTRSPVVAVVDDVFRGAITVAELLRALLPR